MASVYLLYTPTRFRELSAAHPFPVFTHPQLERLLLERLRRPSKYLKLRWPLRRESTELALQLEIEDLATFHLLYALTIDECGLGSPHLDDSRRPDKEEHRVTWFVQERLIRGLVEFLQDLPHVERLEFLDQHARLLPFEHDSYNGVEFVQSDSLLPYMTLPRTMRLDLRVFDPDTQTYAIGKKLDWRWYIRPVYLKRINLDTAASEDEEHIASEFWLPIGDAVLLAASHYWQLMIRDHRGTNLIYAFMHDCVLPHLRRVSQLVDLSAVLHGRVRRVIDQLFQLHKRKLGECTAATVPPLVESMDVEDLRPTMMPACIAAMNYRLMEGAEMTGITKAPFHLKGPERFVYTQAFIAAKGRHDDTAEVVIHHLNRRAREYGPSWKSVSKSIAQDAEKLVLHKDYKAAWCGKVPVCPFHFWRTASLTKTTRSYDTWMYKAEVGRLLFHMGFTNPNALEETRRMIYQYVVVEGQLKEGYICGRVLQCQQMNQNKFTHSNDYPAFISSPVMYIEQMKNLFA